MSIRGQIAPMTVPSETSTRSYGVAYLEHNLPGELAAGTVWSGRLTVENRSERIWSRSHPEGKSVDLVVWIGGKALSTHALPRPEVRPGEQVTFHFPLQAPGHAGTHEFVLDMIEQNVSRFSDQGMEPLRHSILVKEAPASLGAALKEQADRFCPWYYQPSGGVQRGPEGGAYPLFVSKAKGCHFWDTEGRSYLDYVMGWGCALLGYAEPRIQEAVRSVLDTGAIVPLTHALEIEVSQMLAEDIPCAERVVFGKNGSDVCALAARVARIFTGRKTILFSGYHGWQDWWVEHLGFSNCGVPDRPEPLLHRFKFNDREDFRRLFDLHKDDLAAVMLEPSGPAEGPQGFTQEADPTFLKLIASAAKDAGALLIFDEIITGFRYLDGSAQKATGIIPDLACFGKALSGGMPLSALVGRAHVMERAMDHAHYGPTAKGEIYSLAAAKAALQIYREEPVAEHVWNHGGRLKQGINRLCSQIGVAAECVGPPFRTTVIFADQDADRVRLKRTLYFQELLKSGVMTYSGFMLPSFAHDDNALHFLLEAAGRSLEKVAAAEKGDNFDRFIEIPLI